MAPVEVYRGRASGDNMTMLSIVLHFMGASFALNVVDREVALELAEAAYRPPVAERVPGVAKSLADALRCMSDP